MVHLSLAIIHAVETKEEKVSDDNKRIKIHMEKNEESCLYKFTWGDIEVCADFVIKKLAHIFREMKHWS